MIRKSVQRFPDKIMLNQRAKARWRFDLKPSCFSSGVRIGKGVEATKFAGEILFPAALRLALP
jgi:hypothetical protein